MRRLWRWDMVVCARKRVIALTSAAAPEVDPGASSILGSLQIGAISWKTSTRGDGSRPACPRCF
eukprot:7198693-Pyramimonas_sp.AAC.1